MESNRKDCAATFALLLPVKVKLKVEATRSHKSKKQTKPKFLNGRRSMQSEYFAGGVGARQLRHMQGRVLCSRSRVYIVLALQAVLPKPPAEFQPSHSFLPGH